MFVGVYTIETRQEPEYSQVTTLLSGNSDFVWDL